MDATVSELVALRPFVFDILKLHNGIPSRSQHTGCNQSKG